LESAVLCIGAAHLDRKAHASGPVTLGSSNPVSIRRTAGGVARNVAENLARLGLRPALLSRIGADANGAAVLSGLDEAGIDAAFVGFSPAAATASYTALLDSAGDMAVAFADMAIYDELDEALLEKLLPAMSAFPVWFADCNLPARSLAFLLDGKPDHVRLFVDPVSVAKAARLPGALDGIDTLFANLDEAASLAGVRIRAPLDICEAGYRLLARGAGTVVITRGPEGAYLATGAEWLFLPALPARVQDVTGAGDALVAGTILGRLSRLAPRDALGLGLACAALAVETDDTVYGGLTMPAALDRAGLAHLAA
jgi:pseudouridine kinase